MKVAIHFILVTALSCAGVALGCDGDDEATTTQGTTTTSGTTSTTGEGGGGTGGSGGGGTAGPMVPELGDQIDRMGRPAINTALNNAFESDPAVKDEAKDVWNQTAEEQWEAFIPEIQKNLGILDGLNANCGDQLLADPAAGAARYQTLATVLAADKLWVKTDAATCTTYLGVEAALLDPTINDCGGRRLADDVIERSYSVLATGDFVGLDDTIQAEPTKTAGEAFPYLAPAQ